MDHKPILERLSTLDLSTVATEEIFELLKNLGPLGFRPIMVPKGALVMRARRIRPCKDEPTEWAWPRKKADVSYPTVKSALGWGRASMPLESMFYGAVSLREIAHGLSLATHEIWEKHRRTHSSSENEYHAVGLWRVNTDIDLIPVFPWDDLATRTPWFKELRNDFDQVMAHEDPLNRFKTLDFYEYMGREFSRPVSDDESHLYRLSACFAYHCCKRNSGVLYPPAVREVQAWDAYNVSILPEVVDSRMTLEGVLILRDYLRDGHLVTNAFLETPDDWKEDQPFRWKESVSLSRYEIERYFMSAAELT